MNGPLAGRRVLVPRAGDSDGAILGLLRDAGAVPEAVPLLAIGPPTDAAALDVAVRELGAGRYAWVGFASASGVAAVVGRSAALGLARAVPAGTRIGAVGAATAAALHDAGYPADLVPDRGGSAGALAEIWPVPDGDQRVLLPSSEIGLPTLTDMLRAKGYQVDRVAAYAPRPVAVPPPVAADLRAGAFDAVLLMSPSQAAVIVGLNPAAGVLMVAIGATTAAGAAATGLRVAAVADDPTPAGLLAALERAVAGVPAVLHCPP